MAYIKRTYIIERATSFAADKHKDQYRNDGKTLYISHLTGVALVLKKYNFSDEIIAGAILHDTLEDTETTAEELEEKFGKEISGMVSATTYDIELVGLEKINKYINNVRHGSEAVKAIALADKIHNMNNLLYDLEQDPEKVWHTFKTKKEHKLWFAEEVLKMYIETWDHPMVTEYAGLINELKTNYF